MRSPESLAIPALVLVAVLLTLHTQIRMRNVPVFVIGAIVTFSSIVYLVNTPVWAGNVRDVAPIWCDIATNLWLYSSYSSGLACLCICIRFEWITSSRGSTSAYHRTCFEVIVCCLVPLFSIPLRYFASTHRYMIVEDLGCVPAIHASKIAVTIVYGPLFLVVFLILIFAYKTVFNLFRKAHLTSPDALTRTHFFRILGLSAVIGTICPLSLSIVFYRSISLAILPWPGFAAVHQDFSHIPLIPRAIQPPSMHEMQTWFFWSYVTPSCTFVGILASGEEFRRDIAWVHAFLTRKLPTRKEDAHHEIASGSSRGVTTSIEIPIILIGSDLRDEESCGSRSILN